MKEGLYFNESAKHAIQKVRIILFFKVNRLFDIISFRLDVQVTVAMLHYS